MAIRFDGSGESLSRARLTGAKTLMAWLYISVDRNDYTGLFGLADNEIIALGGDGTTLLAYHGATERTGTNLAAGTWYHLAYASQGDAINDDWVVYLNGVSDISQPAHDQIVTGTTMYLGNDAFSEWFNGRMAHIKIWAAYLTDAEIQQEMYSIVPQRLENLWGWLPAIETGSARTNEWSGAGNTWTANGTLTDEDGPGIAWEVYVPGHWLVPAVGGGPVLLSVGGSLTPAGALVRQPRKELAGSVSPAGSTLKQIARLLAGALTPSGAVSNETSGGTTPLSVSGALVPSGALLRQVNKSIAGALTPTGSMLRQAGKRLAGAMQFGSSPGSIRFYGTGYSGGLYDDLDRVVIPIDGPETKPAWATATGYDADDYVANDEATYICTANHTSGATTEPGVGASWETVWDLVLIPADIGAGDFTIEFFAQGNTTDNDSTGATEWIEGNIIIDRDRFNAGRKFGISFTDGALMFGVGGTLTATIVGSTNALDDAWHHFACMRRLSDGRTWIMVDGVQDATGIQETGDQSYPDGVRSGDDDPNDRDHYLVIGAEKHDAGSAYPSFAGRFAELRLSDNLRYDPAGFTPPTAAFVADANTMGLWHFDEGSGTTVVDNATVSGQRANGTLNVGGPSNGPTWATDSPFAVSGGLLTLLVGVILTGVVTPAGTVLKAFGRLWGGAVAPSGLTVRQAQTSQAGSLTPAGGLLRQVRKLLTGSLTPGGTVATIRTVLLSLAGTLTPGGVVNRQVRLIAGGAVQPVGTALKSVRRVFGGVVTPSGTIAFIGTLLLSVAGSLTPSGTVSRRINRLLAGSLGPGGSVSRLVSKGLSGTVAPSGTAAQIISNVLAIAGALTPSGVVGRRVNKVLSGSLEISGGLGKRASRLFNGALSPSGLVSFGETVINEVQTLAKAMAKAMFKRMR